MGNIFSNGTIINSSFHSYYDNSFVVSDVNWSNNFSFPTLDSMDSVNKSELRVQAAEWLSYQAVKLMGDNEVAMVHRHGAMTWVCYYFFNMSVDEYFDSEVLL